MSLTWKKKLVEGSTVVVVFYIFYCFHIYLIKSNERRLLRLDVVSNQLYLIKHGSPSNAWSETSKIWERSTSRKKWIVEDHPKPLNIRILNPSSTRRKIAQDIINASLSSSIASLLLTSKGKIFECSELFFKKKKEGSKIEGRKKSSDITNRCWQG